MPETTYLLAALMVGFVVTVSLRALPFVVIGPLRRSSVIRYLGVHMPAGVMVILTAYTLKDVAIAAWPHGLPEALALALTIGLHVWKRNAVVSILVGTATYVALVAGLPTP